MKREILEKFTEKEEIKGPYELPEGWRGLNNENFNSE